MAIFCLSAASLISDSSIKGSVICAPDGEIVIVGESLGSRRETGSVGDISQLQLDATEREGEPYLDNATAKLFVSIRHALKFLTSRYGGTFVMHLECS